jgi:phosphatidylglycerophosphate synthase
LAEIDYRLKKTPYVIVILRITLTPLLFYSILYDFTHIAVLLFFAAFSSDILDGFLAKKFKTISSSFLEAYSDPIADFVLVLMAFSAFTLKEIYPSWILILLVFMFLFFIITSNRQKPLYDPVGKYYGMFLIAAIGITLLFPMEIVFNSVFLSILGYTIILVIFRTIFLWKSRMLIED